MCEPTTILTVAGMAVTAMGQYQQGKSAQDSAKYNATMSDYAAQDALRRGEEESQSAMRRARSIKSSQRVALAANGLDVGYGTAQDLQDDTDFFGQMDSDTARYNASRDAWTARAGGQLSLAEGRAAAYQGGLQAGGTLLSAAGYAAKKWPQKPPAKTTSSGG